MPNEPNRQTPSFWRSQNLRICLWACTVLLLHLQLAAQLPSEPKTVRIGVFSLFHPHILTLTAEHPITLLLDGTPHILDAHQIATLRSTTAGIIVEHTLVRTVALPPGTFILAVPGKLVRSYRGSLGVTLNSAAVLVPVVTMETELAVASIVAAEAPPNAPLEALKAQAIASRSFLLANSQTHLDYDACDTTHCQYLRSPPAATSPAAIATRATRNVVLTWRPSPDAQPQIIAAMYSRSCGGQTRVPNRSGGPRYPYYSVACDYCRRHPELWSRSTGTPAPESEKERIDYNRTHGWSAIPSNNYTETDSGLEGRGIGHGIGLCQLGAADLARHGESYAQILAHYYPNTALFTMPQ